MLLSRDDILAVYATSGRETLQLLTGGARAGNAPIGLKDSILSNGEARMASGSFDAAKGERPPQGAGSAQGEAEGSSKERGSADHDALTGLSNRSHFQCRFARALAEAPDSGKKVALALLGLDNFKDVNSTLGHKAGDCLLIEVADRIQNVLGGKDTASRFGSDEFAFFLTNLKSEKDMEPISHGLMEAVSDTMAKHAPKLRPSASLGVAMYPDHGTDALELIQNGDIALRQAKTEGKGRIKFFEPSMRAALDKRLHQLELFKSLLRSGHLRPFYQPQIRLSDRRSYGFEALARGVQPDGRILYPGEFLAALEEPETAILLGEHMLRSVSEDLHQWRETEMPACKISVNVAGPELTSDDYHDKVADLFLSKGLPLSLLTLEITESVLFDDFSKVAKTLANLRKLGVSISLDDFGTGYASLTHLKSFPIDQIKIDRSFVTNLPVSVGDRAIVRATITMAKGLGIGTVAEGLENEEQLRALRMLGCDYGQGFLFSPAVPTDEAEQYFRRNRAYRRAVPPYFAIPAPRH